MTNEGQDWPVPQVNRETTVVLAALVSAKYHPEEGFLIVKVKMPDSSTRALPIHASTFKYYHGVKYDVAPKVLIDKEMFKTEQLFNAAAAKGRRIRLKLFKEQVELDGLSIS